MVKVPSKREDCVPSTHTYKTIEQLLFSTLSYTSLLKYQLYLL